MEENDNNQDRMDLGEEELAIQLAQEREADVNRRNFIRLTKERYEFHSEKMEAVRCLQNPSLLVQGCLVFGRSETRQRYLYSLTASGMAIGLSDSVYPF